MTPWAPVVLSEGASAPAPDAVARDSGHGRKRAKRIAFAQTADSPDSEPAQRWASRTRATGVTGLAAIILLFAAVIAVSSVGIPGGLGTGRRGHGQSWDARLPMVCRRFGLATSASKRSRPGASASPWSRGSCWPRTAYGVLDAALWTVLAFGWSGPACGWSVTRERSRGHAATAGPPSAKQSRIDRVISSAMWQRFKIGRRHARR